MKNLSLMALTALSLSFSFSAQASVPSGRFWGMQTVTNVATQKQTTFRMRVTVENNVMTVVKDSQDGGTRTIDLEFRFKNNEQFDLYEEGSLVAKGQCRSARCEAFSTTSSMREASYQFSDAGLTINETWDSRGQGLYNSAAQLQPYIKR